MSTTARLIYSNIETNDSSEALGKQDEESWASWASNSRRRKCISVLVLGALWLGVAVIVLAVVVGFSAGARQAIKVPEAGASSINHLVAQDCGRNATEAREWGCIFDIVTNNWIPADCSDETTAAEFRHWVQDQNRFREAWPYFYDKEGVRQVESEQELSELVGRRIYTTTENHLGHCVFLMRRLHRSLEGGVSKVGGNTFQHTLHCTSSVLKAVGKLEDQDRGQITSSFDVGIGKCQNLK